MREDIRLPAGDGDIDAVVHRPDGDVPDGGWPAVIVLYEIYGTATAMVEAARRFAENGYVAVLPDILGGRGLRCLAKGLIEVSRAKPGPVTDNIEATRMWLAGQSDVDSDRVGVAGFCMGGGFALLYAGTGAPVSAAGVNYGFIPRNDETLRGACPVVASYGGRDMVLAKPAAALADRLSALGITHDVRTYPEAGHSFMSQDSHPVAELLRAAAPGLRRRRCRGCLDPAADLLRHPRAQGRGVRRGRPALCIALGRFFRAGC